LQAEPQRKIKTLSRGNRQKIGLIQALMHNPDLIILDEPTRGLDPLVQRVFYELVLEMKQQGKTVFLSSHNLTEVQKICDRAAFIREGNLVAIENIANAQDLTFHRYIIEFARYIIEFVQPPQPDVFASLSEVHNVEVQGTTVRLDVSGSVDAFIKTLAQYEVVALDEQELSLEDIFMHYYEKEPIT